MKKTGKRWISLIVAFSMICTLAACGGGQKGDNSQAPAAKGAAAETKAEEKAEAAPGGKATVIKLGHIFAQDGSANLAVEKFAQLVKEKTDGAYEIQIYPNSQLGDERELCEAVTLGTVDMTLCGDSFINWYVPEYGALCAFFTWKNFDHAEKAYRREIGKELSEAYSKACKTTILDYWMRAPRYVCCNKEIRTMDGMKGLTLRIPDDTLYTASFKALGANPTPMAFDEIYLGIKQKTVEGLENPLEDLYNNSFYDVTKYIIETKHQISMFALMINNDSLAKLPEDVQKILYECAAEAGDYQNELMEKAEADYKQKLEEKGMTFILPDDLDNWYDVINTEVPPQFKDVWKDGVLERALELE